VILRARITLGNADAEIANAIFPVIRRHHLTQADTEKALTELHVPRAANIARISGSLGL
jgi:hypothetical protein